MEIVINNLYYLCLLKSLKFKNAYEGNCESVINSAMRKLIMKSLIENLYIKFFIKIVNVYLCQIVVTNDDSYEKS